jgi:cell division protein FtsI/penicillin-binding protein 2
MAMCAIANEGRLMRPMLVSRLQDTEGNVCAQYEPQVVREAVRPEAARLLVSALKTVACKGGTAPQAAMDHYTVAGKTGTAQKVIDRVYVHGKYISSFIGFFPADNPEVCISVFLDEPKNGYYGGSTAAPFFRKIAEQVANYLKIKPDQQEPGTDTEAALGTLKTASLAGPQ